MSGDRQLTAKFLMAELKFQAKKFSCVYILSTAENISPLHSEYTPQK